MTALTACGSEENGSTEASTPKPTAAAPLRVTDAWVKTAANGMTGAFGTLVNNTDREVTVVSGTSPAAQKVELHEVAMDGGKMVMRPKSGGFVVPAHGSHQLQPGADHLMLLGISAPIKPGDQVTFNLTVDSGTPLTFTAVAKDFAGANENYQPGGSASPSMGMDMSPGTGASPGVSMSPHGTSAAR